MTLPLKKGTQATLSRPQQRILLYELGEYTKQDTALVVRLGFRCICCR